MSDIKGNITFAGIAHLRSLLFTPGSDPQKLVRALTRGADAVAADLEDAIPDTPEEKAAARSATVLAFSGPRSGSARVVRINGCDTPHFEADLAAVAELDLDAIMLPKATPDAVVALGASGPPLIALVETALGVRSAYEIAASPRVEALALGAADLGAELWLDPHPDGQELLYARSKLVTDSAAAGIRPPIDAVHLNVYDAASLEAEAALARRLGFRGKLCIHPAQIAVVNSVFAPSPAEIEWAREVIEAHTAAAGEGRGALLVHGRLVDRAVVRRAELLLAAAQAGEDGAAPRTWTADDDVPARHPIGGGA